MSDNVVQIQLQGGPGDGYQGTCEGASSVLFTVMPEDGSLPQVHSYRRTQDQTEEGRAVYDYHRFVGNLGRES